MIICMENGMIEVIGLPDEILCECTSVIFDFICSLFDLL